MPLLTHDQSAKVTVVCMVCAASFDAAVTPQTKTKTPGWFDRYVRRQQPVDVPDGHAVVTTLRES